MAYAVLYRLLQRPFTKSCHHIRQWTKYLLARPSRYHLLLTTTFIAKCDTRPRIDLQEPDPNTLSQEYLLRSVSSQTADAVTAMLSQAARALIEAEEKYRKALTILTDLTEQHMSVLGNEEEENIVWDIILQARYQLDVLNRKRKDLEILFSCVQKLADASAEVAFLAGTEFLSTSMGERMHNAQRHVESARAETERAEEILRETQAINVKITTEHAEKQKSECVDTDTDLEENVNKSAS